MQRPAIAWVGVLLVVAVLFAACTGDDDPASDPDATATPEGIAPPPGPTDTLAGPTEVAEPFEGARDPVEVPDPIEPGVPVLMDVRTGLHDDFDRVVFEYDGHMPGYRVEYVSAPIMQCGSGIEEPVDGTAFLQVLMSFAAARDETGATFDLMEILPALPSIVEVQVICVFEGNVTWVLGLTSEQDFRVFTLEDPSRVVVDVAHP